MNGNLKRKTKKSIQTHTVLDWRDPCGDIHFVCKSSQSSSSSLLLLAICECIFKCLSYAYHLTRLKLWIYQMKWNRIKTVLIIIIIIINICVLCCAVYVWRHACPLFFPYFILYIFIGYTKAATWALNDFNMCKKLTWKSNNHSNSNIKSKKKMAIYWLFRLIE